WVGSTWRLLQGWVNRVKVISGTAQVVVVRTDPVVLGHRLGQGLLIESAAQDRFHGLTRRRTNGAGADTRRLQTRRTVLAGQRQQAQATAIAHFRMRTIHEQVFNQMMRGRTDVRGPALEAPG